MSDSVCIWQHNSCHHLFHLWCVSQECIHRQTYSRYSTISLMYLTARKSLWRILCLLFYCFSILFMVMKCYHQSPWAPKDKNWHYSKFKFFIFTFCPLTDLKTGCSLCFFHYLYHRGNMTSRIRDVDLVSMKRSKLMLFWRWKKSLKTWSF